MTGSPVPAIDLRLGPVGFAPLPDDRLALLEGTSIVDHVDRPGFWGNIARPAAEQFTGTPLVAIGLGVVAVAAVVLVARQRPLGVRHAVAAAAVVGCIAYPFAPYSAPIVGHPTTNPIVVLIVALNVRYLLPPLIVLLCLVPVGLAGLSRRIGDVAVVVATATTAQLWRRSLSFDAEWPTTTDDAVLGTVVVLLAAAVVPGCGQPARRGADVAPVGDRRRRRRRRRHRGGALVARRRGGRPLAQLPRHAVRARGPVAVRPTSSTASGWPCWAAGCSTPTWGPSWGPRSTTWACHGGGGDGPAN